MKISSYLEPDELKKVFLKNFNLDKIVYFVQPSIYKSRFGSIKKKLPEKWFASDVFEILTKK